MAFKGITFAGQNVTPKNDGALYGAHYGDGILDGCTMTISGDDLVIASGHFIAGGRVCQVDGATNVDLSGRLLSTGYIQVIMNYDLSQSEGSQWYTTFVESATTTFPALTQDEINNNGDLYQKMIAIIQVSGGNLTSIYDTMGVSNVVGYAPDGSLRGGLAGSNENFFIWGKRQASGQIISGLRVGDEAVMIGADGQQIVFRPNGMYASTGQAYLDTDGLLVTQDVRRYTPQTYSNSKLSSTSVSANSNVKVCDVQVTKAGVYLIQVTAHIVMSSAGSCNMNVYGALNNSNKIAFMAQYCKASSAWIESAIYATFTAGQYCSFYLEPNLACTYDTATLDLIRIA